MPAPPSDVDRRDAARGDSPSRRGFWPYVLLALLLFLGLAHLLRSQQRALIERREIETRLSGEGRPLPLAQVQQAVRAMELVTLRVHSTARKELRSELWRGDAQASVEAPVTYLYGVDLSRVGPADVLMEPLSRTCFVRVPEPERLAVEVDMSAPREYVRVSGMRLRSRAGNYLLGLARREVYEAAREAVLPPEQIERVREESRRRVAELVQKLYGDETRVAVRFERDRNAPVDRGPEEISLDSGATR